MAANNYFDHSSTRHANPYYDATTSYAAERPPLSQNYSPYNDASPSPFYAGQSQTSFAVGKQRQNDSDVWDNNNSIPLSGRRAKHESTQTIEPMLSHPPPDDDPFVRDIDPNKRVRGRTAAREGGWFSGKITWAVYILSIIELVVFIAELVKNGVLTKTPIEIHPSFNPMIGPSPYVLINMGARYQPCMHSMPNVQNSSTQIYWPCPNATATTGDSVSCSLSDLCGFNGVPDPHVGGSIDDSPAPDQWWRFIVPIFIHAGIIHIGFNLLLQLTLGRDVEKLIGTIRFTIVYFAAGIFGFVLGGNFAANGIASCGCSGSLFGILAITLLDLLYTWRDRPSPVKDLLFIVVDVLIAFVLGLLPGLDNFSHIGGFLMGLVLGVCILRSPTAIAVRRSSQYVEPWSTQANSPYESKNNVRGTGMRDFARAPQSFFRDRRGVWWIWGLVRAAALVGVLVGFILLLKNFYVWRTSCSWCKYLSCLPIKVGGTNWCSVGNLNFTPQQGAASS